MKLSRYLAALTPMLLAVSAPSEAQVPVDQIRLGTPSYNGTGCPLGTVSASLSPDAQSLSVLFGQFVAESGGVSGRVMDRKACNISIPVNVPHGLSVSLIKIDYRGYHRLPVNTSATFDVEYFFAGQSGPSYHKAFIGSLDGNFTINSHVTAAATVWSPCGQEVNLRTNTSIAVQSSMTHEQAMITLDSADYSAGVVYQLRWKQCGANPNPYPTPVNPYPTPYNPYPTPYPYPTPVNPYPTPYPYPTPVDPYPPQVGACVISSYFDQRGHQMFMVKDGSGRVLGNTVQFADAMRLAQQSQQRGFCYGIVNQVQNPNPYPYPTPYPQPQPQPVPSQQQCRLQTGRNSYGQPMYRVQHRSGQILITTPHRPQAVQVLQSDPRCFRR